MLAVPSLVLAFASPLAVAARPGPSDRRVCRPARFPGVGRRRLAGLDRPQAHAVDPRPTRQVAQVLGLVATIVFALVLSAWADAPCRTGGWSSAVTFGLTALATALGGRTLREEGLPTLSGRPSSSSPSVVGLAVAVAVWWPDRSLALAALPIVALLVVVAANPLQRGLGDLAAHEPRLPWQRRAGRSARASVGPRTTSRSTRS